MNKKLSVLIISAMLLPSISTKSDINISAEDTVIKSAGFEQSTDGFLNTMGNIKLEICDTISYSGKSCLKATNRSDGWHGATLDCQQILKSGVQYSIHFYVYHESTSAENIMCTLKSTDSSYGDLYTPVSITRVEPGKWTEVYGTFEFPELTQTAYMYIESSNGKMDIYMDDFTMTELYDGKSQTPDSNVQNGMIPGQPPQGEMIPPPDGMIPGQPPPDGMMSPPDGMIPGQPPSDGMMPPTDDMIPSENITSDPVSSSDNDSTESSEKSLAIAIILGITISLILIIFIYELRKNIIQNKKDKIELDNATDKMTQTFNKETFEQQIQELSQNPILCQGIHITICDINYLGNINNSYGNDKGDTAITRCGNILMKVAGNKGSVYRVNGGQFICLSQISIKKRLEKELQYEYSKYEGYPFSLAVGYAEHIKGDIPDINVLMEKAYLDMHENKKIVKNAPKVL